MSIEIHPGGSDELNSLKKQYITAKEEIEEILLKYKVDSIEIADKHFELRKRLEQQLLMLDKASAQSIEVKKKELEEYRQKDVDLNQSYLSELKYFLYL